MFMLPSYEVVFIEDIIIHYGNVDINAVNDIRTAREIYFVEKIFSTNFNI